MDVRSADADDRAAIREIARESFQTSFALSPGQIETIVDVEFSDDALGDRIDDPDLVILVAEDGGDVVGFADVGTGDEGTLRWLHVDPDARGQGAGTALVERARDELAERGLAFTAWVLEEATEGDTFLERFGLQQAGSEWVEFAGERFHVHVYAAGAESHDANEPAVEVPRHVDVDGDERPVDRDEPIPGTEAPFFPIYLDEGRERRYGFFCSNCGNTDVSADGLDRLECGSCGNTHLADEWDSAYL